MNKDVKNRRDVSNLSASLLFVGNLNPKDRDQLFHFLLHAYFLLNISFPLPWLSCFSDCFSFLSFLFSLITLYLPFSTHRLRLPSPWLSFIESKPHFLHSTYSGRPFSLQMPSFSRIKALVQNQFPLLSIMFFFLPPNLPFMQVFYSSQLIVFCSQW